MLPHPGGAYLAVAPGVALVTVVPHLGVQVEECLVMGSSVVGVEEGGRGTTVVRGLTSSSCIRDKIIQGPCIGQSTSNSGRTSKFHHWPLLALLVALVSQLV